jgi:hypothetical protein
MSEQTQTQNEALITKMSVKTLGCKPTGGLPADDSKPNDLCIIAGKAVGYKMGEGNDSKLWCALIGSFRGTNLATGQSFRSGKLFLPSGIQEVVEGAVRGLTAEGGNVKFAFRIASVKATNPIGYSYQATSLIPMTAEEDTLSDLIAILPGVSGYKQIEAPATESEKPSKAAKK